MKNQYSMTNKLDIENRKTKTLKLKIPKGYVPTEYEIRTEGDQSVLVITIVPGGFYRLIKKFLHDNHFAKSKETRKKISTGKDK